MKKLLPFFFLLSSCAPVYLPNMRNVPMLTKQGEFQATAAIGNGGLQVQSAVAVTNHIALAINYANSSEKEYRTDRVTLDERRYHRLLEGSAGYYENVGIMFYEISVGYGQGKGYSYDADVTAGNAEGKYSRYFIQPAFGLNKSNFHAAVAPRISMIDFKEYTNEDFAAPVNLPTVIFLEPAVIGRLNTLNNRLFFNIQAGVAFPLIEREGRPVDFDYRLFQLSCGMGLRLGGLKEIKAK